MVGPIDLCYGAPSFRCTPPTRRVFQPVNPISLLAVPRYTIFNFIPNRMVKGWPTQATPLGSSTHSSIVWLWMDAALYIFIHLTAKRMHGLMHIACYGPILCLSLPQIFYEGSIWMHEKETLHATLQRYSPPKSFLVGTPYGSTHNTYESVIWTVGTLYTSFAQCMSAIGCEWLGDR